MTRTIIDINILHTVPPSNINRDDTGSPKTAVYGGVRRARVSSQAWKRATRLAFQELLDKSKLGVRTKRVVELLAERIHKISPEISFEDAAVLSSDTLKAAGVSLSKARTSKGEDPKLDEAGFLMFLSDLQINHLANAAISASKSEDPAASLKAAELKKKLDLDHSVDISLFGRMVADATDLNVDAAAQVAHAISVHGVDTEFDYFTAVDDHKAADDEEDAGAGMIGTVEFNSSTLYRYATVDVDRLLDNLGDIEATRKAVEAFIDAFATSMPTGKQNTFANRTLPEAIVVSIRERQPVNLAGAFEVPVQVPRVENAVNRLVEKSQEIDQKFGTEPKKTWTVLSGGESTDALTTFSKDVADVSLSGLLAQVGKMVSDRLESNAAKEKA